MGNTRNKQAVFEWNEDYKYGSHYHVMPFGSNKHTGVHYHIIPFNGSDHGNMHYWPGLVVPEPYNSLYFGW